MKNIKDIVIGLFAVIGFTAIITGFTNEAEQQVIHTSPESHVWELTNVDGRAYAINKTTGEVRGYYNLIISKGTKTFSVGLREYKAKPVEYGEMK